MEELLALKERMQRQRPEDWDHLPDIGLYMDQVITYFIRLGPIFWQDGLTPAMVNNYIKVGLLPRAEGKKYSRTHLAYLTEICILKQVLSVKDISLLLEEGARNATPREFYQSFLKSIDEALGTAAKGIEEDWDLARVAEEAAAAAVASCALKITSEKLLDIVRDKKEAKERDKTAEMHSEKDRAKKNKGAKK